MDGNTLSDSSGRTYTWDTENRMTSCTYQGATTTYTYGADGLRRSMTANGVTTEYAYDGATLIREFQAATTATLKSGQTLGAFYPSATYFVGPRGPEYRRSDISGAVRWYIYDGLGSVVGEVAPYGIGNFDSSPGSEQIGYNNVAGYEAQWSTRPIIPRGLVLAGHRCYQPQTRRWLIAV